HGTHCARVHTARDEAAAVAELRQPRRTGRTGGETLWQPLWGPVAQEDRPSAMFVADRRHRAVQIPETASMIREVGLLLSESLERTRDVEPGALVCDCDQRALAGRRHLDDNGLCGVAAVAVFRGIAESIPQRYQQIRQQVRPRHRGETVRQDNLEQRKQIVPPVAPKSQMNIYVRDPWGGDV